MKKMLRKLVDQAKTSGKPLSPADLKIVAGLVDYELSMLSEVQRRNLLAEVIMRLDTRDRRHDARLLAAAMSLRLEELAEQVAASG